MKRKVEGKSSRGIDGLRAIIDGANEKKVVVECVGLPGSGKTTICRSISQSATSGADVDARIRYKEYYRANGSRCDVYAGWVIFIVTNPGVALMLIYLLVKYRGFRYLSPYLKAARWNRWIRSEVVISNRNTLLLDEGPVQWTLKYGPFEDEYLDLIIDTYRANTDVSYAFCFFDTDVSTCVSRVMRRDKAMCSWKDKKEDVLRRLFLDQIRVVQQVRQLIDREFEVVVIES